MTDIEAELKTLLKATFGSMFTTYFQGKVEIVPQANLPILMVYGLEERQKHSGTLRDDAEFDIAIEVQINLKDFLDNENAPGEILDTEKKLKDLVAERETTGEAKAATIFGIVNANLDINGKTIYTDNLRAVYSTPLRDGKFPMANVVVTFTAFSRPDRV